MPLRSTAIWSLSVLVGVVLLSPAAEGSQRALSEVVSLGLVKIKVRGVSMRAVEVSLTASEQLDVEIRSGTFFDTGKSEAYQRMIVLRSLVVHLEARKEKVVQVETACANFHRSVPTSTDTFVLGAAPKPLELLVQCLERSNAKHEIAQLLVWESTDKITRQRLSERPGMVKQLLIGKCNAAFPSLDSGQCERMVTVGIEHVVDGLMSESTALRRACSSDQSEQR